MKEKIERGPVCVCVRACVRACVQGAGTRDRPVAEGARGTEWRDATRDNEPACGGSRCDSSAVLADSSE
jgi:hypothetical protein